MSAAVDIVIPFGVVFIFLLKGTCSGKKNVSMSEIWCESIMLLSEVMCPHSVISGIVFERLSLCYG